MTDLSDRPASAAPDVGSRPGPADVPPGPERSLLAALLVGAGAIHLAMAPSHLGESGVEGAGFIVAARAQLALSVAVLVRPPSRRVLAAVGVTNVALIVAWVVSRTAGLPFGSHRGHAESVSIVDGVCVALEALAVVVAVALVTGWGAAVARARGVVLVGTVSAVLLTTGAVASPAARDHAAGSHGDHGDHAASESAAGGEGEHAHGAAADDDGFAALSNGHQHGTDEPLTPEETVALAQQLAATTELVERYPTVADAVAAGWTRAGPSLPASASTTGVPTTRR